MRHKTYSLWNSFLGLLYLNPANVRPCPGGAKRPNLWGFLTPANVDGPYAYDWGSMGRRFKSCQPDWEVEASQEPRVGGTPVVCPISVMFMDFCP